LGKKKRRGEKRGKERKKEREKKEEIGPGFGATPEKLSSLPASFAVWICFTLGKKRKRGGRKEKEMKLIA